MKITDPLKGIHNFLHKKKYSSDLYTHRPPHTRAVLTLHHYADRFTR